MLLYPVDITKNSNPLGFGVCPNLLLVLVMFTGYSDKFKLATVLGLILLRGIYSPSQPQHKTYMLKLKLLKIRGRGKANLFMYLYL